MAGKYASAKHAFGLCDRCGQRYKLNLLKPLQINLKLTNIRVCPTCWEPDQPQYKIGRLKITDPQAILNARPDSAFQSFRSKYWGWNPVQGTPLEFTLGAVTVTIT
jgi:hypothetical protein